MKPTVARRYTRAERPACQTTSRRALRAVRHLYRAAKALPAGIARATVIGEALTQLAGTRGRRALRLVRKLCRLGAA